MFTIIAIVLDLFFGLLGIILIILSIWNGFVYEIGKTGDHFHNRFELYPLKRFFNHTK